MARTKNQAARRAELRVAAEQALRQRGPQHLRVKDIADLVGITPPAVSYYFPDLDDLILQTYQRVTVRFVERRRAAAAAVSDPALKLATLIENGVPSGPDDQDAVLTYQMVSEPSASAAYGTLSAMLFSSEVLLYRSVLDVGTQLGCFRPSIDQQVIARCLVAMEDALGLRIVFADSEIDRPTAIRDLRAVAEALTATCLPTPLGPVASVDRSLP